MAADPTDADPLGQPISTTPTVTIDGKPTEAPGEEVTGAELLALVGKSPDSHDLYAKGHHGLRIGAEDAVEVHDGAQFETRPRRV